MVERWEVSLIQFCWLVFSVLGVWFWIGTKWSTEGWILLKGAVSFSISACIAMVVFIIGSVFKWLGG